MTITEFLLARIAEDEQVARRADETRVHVDPDLNAGAWVCHDLGTHVGVSPHRVLAECKEKRLIVALLTDNRSITPDRLASANRDVLAGLAAVYADHPDYDEAWRP